MADTLTRDELLALGYTAEEIGTVLGLVERPKSVNPKGVDESPWEGWYLTSSSNVAAIRWNRDTTELQVQFHPSWIQKRGGRVTQGRSAGSGHSFKGTTWHAGGGKLPKGTYPHGHDTGEYVRYTAPGFSESWGPIYSLNGVSESLWRQFESASDSFGTFYNQHLKHGYGAHKISG